MKLAAIVLAMFASMNASAIYVNANPPTGWSSPDINSESKHLWKAPANSTYVTPIRNPAGKLVFPAQTTIQTAGKLTKFPVAFTQAANAARYIARRSFTIASLTPYALAGLAAWLSQAGLQTWIDPITGEQVWAKQQIPNNLYPYYAGQITGLTAENVCIAIQASGFGGQTFTYFQPGGIGDTVGYCYFSGGSFVGVKKCPYENTYWNGAGCVVANPQLQPVSKPQFEEDIDPLSIPEDLPEKLPFPIPVDDPVQNPVPFPLGPPTPWTVPTGDPSPAPQPRPNPDPYPWQQPGVTTKPSPKPGEPLRNDQVPTNTPLPTNQGNDSPNPAPVPTPATQPSGGGAPAPEEKKGELCDYFPKILACAEMTAPSEVPVPNKDVPIAITPTEGIGASNGVCPADKQVNLALVGTITVSYDLVCRYVEGLRPVVIALAWLTAAMIFVGAIKRD